MDIIVSGSLAYDRIMDFPGKFSDHILPDKIHILNVCFAINGLRENFGGTAGNIAYGLALQGERPLIVSAAGRDFSAYRRWLAGLELPLDGVTTVEEELTACAYITTDQSDNQITAFNPGAMKHTAPYRPSRLSAAETLAIVAPGNYDDMRRLVSLYRDHGVPYIFDPGQSLPAWSGEELAALARGASIFISNDYELELTLEKSGLAVEGLAEIVGAVITTRAEFGSVIRRMEHGRIVCADIPAVPVERALDPTGAGDAYRAGLIKGLIHRPGDLINAARMGSVAASFAVETYGTQTYSYDRLAYNRRFRECFGTEPL
jgi:adenosine kinase